MTESAVKQITLPVTGMTCANCVAAVERNLNKLEGVNQVSVNLATERANVEFDPDLLVISPGPGTPDSAGVSLEAVGYFKDKLPILGVCLGHQVIVQHFGGRIGHAPKPMHGKPSRVTHNGEDIFAGIENPLQAGRYHSLVAIEVLDCLEKTAEFDGIVMGVRHKELPIFGVQFHPESILTPAGGKIIENILSIAKAVKIKATNE